MTRSPRWPLVAAFLIALSGCAGSPAIDYYTLDALPYPEARGDDSAPLTVLLGPLSLPEMVDRPQLVVRSGDNRVEIVDTSRWAQPLKSELARALAANLARDLGTLRVFLAEQSLHGEPDISVSVDVLRFESRLGVEAVMEARWTIRRKGGAAPLTGRSLIRETVQGKGYEFLVAAHGRALARISREIAEAIRRNP